MSLSVGHSPDGDWCDCCPDYDDVGAGVDPNVRADSLTSPGPEDLNKTFCFSWVGSMLGFIIFSSKKNSGLWTNPQRCGDGRF